MRIIGDYKFSDPVKLEDWKPTRDSGIYVIFYQADPHNLKFAYIGQSSDYSERGFPWGHEHATSWLNLARHKDNVFISLHKMPSSTEEQRCTIEKELIDLYKPPCNKEL